MDSLNSAITSLIPLVVSTVAKHVAYPFNTGNNIEDLQSNIRDLVAKKMDVKTKIENAERQHGVPTKSAEEWLAQVEKIEKEAEQIVENYQQSQNRCLWSRCADIWSNYKISKKAIKKLTEVKSLCEKQTNLEVTIIKPPPLGQEMPDSSSKSPSFQLALKEINDGVNNIIGIWGKGGVGKTHLLKQINNELCKTHAFDAVIFVTCSKDCSEEKVQDVIIDRLGLDKNSNLKQNTICEFLKQRSFVLLLDDLWSRIDIDKVGIPDLMSTTGSWKRKIVLTTRSKDVCRDMESKKLIPIDVLKWDQAWSLFVSKVTKETVMSNPLIREYAIEVAQELGGLPLALITVGRAMHDKKDTSDWENALELLMQAGLDDVSNESVFHTLSFSYNNLRNETLKECFLHCSLWPEDYSIDRNELIELWMGVGLINEPHKIQSAYNAGYNYIKKLQDVCLLEEGDSFEGVPRIKMHDVIRDMALWIANDRGSKKNKWISQHGMELWQINVPGETDKLSVQSCECKSVNCMSSCPMLSTLLFKNNGHLAHLQLELFLGLVVLDLEQNGLRDFPVELCKLDKLQFLNLSRNNMTSLPEELGALINLKYLLLRNNTSDNKRAMRIPYGIISKLRDLRVLDISTCVGDDESTLDLSWLEELKLLGNFQALGITTYGEQELEKLLESNVPVRWLIVSIGSNPLTICDSFFGNSHMQTNLFSLKIYGMLGRLFEIKIGGACFLERLEQLCFNSARIKDIVWGKVEPKDVLSRLRILDFYLCDIQDISWVVHLPCLCYLRVWGVFGRGMMLENLLGMRSGTQLIHAGEVEVSYPTFPLLKTMVLENLLGLESICDPKITFPALETLQVSCCPQLRKLPFRVDCIPPKLKQIRGQREWWNNIQWENNSLRCSLQPFFVQTEILSILTFKYNLWRILREQNL